MISKACQPDTENAPSSLSKRKKEKKKLTESREQSVWFSKLGSPVSVFCIFIFDFFFSPGSCLPVCLFALFLSLSLDLGCPSVRSSCFPQLVKVHQLDFKGQKKRRGGIELIKSTTCDLAGVKKSIFHEGCLPSMEIEKVVSNRGSSQCHLYNLRSVLSLSISTLFWLLIIQVDADDWLKYPFNTELLL